MICVLGLGQVGVWSAAAKSGPIPDVAVAGSWFSAKLGPTPDGAWVGGGGWSAATKSGPIPGGAVAGVGF